MPVFMFTAHARDVAEAVRGQTARRVNAGLVGVVPKPFDLTTLIDVVDGLLKNPARPSRRSCRR